jgi:hypothetical protein
MNPITPLQRLAALYQVSTQALAPAQVHMDCQAHFVELEKVLKGLEPAEKTQAKPDDK